MKKLLSLVLLFSNTLIYTQDLENPKLHFGNHTSIDFNTQILDSNYINESTMNTIEVCASVSDSNENVLFFTVEGYMQNNRKVKKLIISPAEMTSTSSVMIHFKEKGDYSFIILKDNNTVFSKELKQVKKVSFKIDFADFNLGKYQIIVKDNNETVLYDEQITKK